MSGPVAPGLFEIADDGSITLVGGFSPSSGHHHFPRGPVCPYTGADDVEPSLLPRSGRLWAWTAVTHAPPGYDGPVPYGFGVVELDGVGLRVLTRVTEPDPSRLREGQPLVLVAEDLGGGTLTWAFAPEGGA